MNFVNSIKRKNPAVAPPTSRAFEAGAWRELFRATAPHTKRDQEVFQLGLMLGNQRGRIDASQGELERYVRPRTIGEMHRLIAAKINQFQVTAFAAWSEVLNSTEPVLLDAIRIAATFQDGAGNLIAPQSAMETTIDAAEHAIRYIDFRKGFGSLEGAANDHVAFDQILGRLLELSSRSVALERVWKTVLWLDASVYVDQMSQQYLVSEESSDLAKRMAVDLTRRPAFLSRDFLEQREVSLRFGASSRAVLVPEEASTGPIKVKTQRLGDLPENLQAMMRGHLASALFIHEHSLLPLGSELHPKLGVKIQELKNIWHCLSGLALQSYWREDTRRRSLQDAGMNSQASLSSCFDEISLITGISSVVNLPEEVVRRCIDFLIFSGMRSTTLWDRPILRGDGGLVLIWWSQIGRHDGRVIAQWAKSSEDLNKKIQNKGKFNEQFLVAALQASLKTGPFQNHAHYIGQNLEPKAKPELEIDLLLLVEQTLFVIEAVSVQHPADPFEFWELEKRLDHKAGQCRDRVEFLDKNPDQIQLWLEEQGIGTNVTSVVGVVVGNTYLRDGMFLSDIHFVHFDTLLSAIGQGGFLFGVMRDGEKGVTLRAPTSPSSKISAANVLLRAIHRSPKSEYYDRAMELTTFKIPPADRSDVSGILIGWHHAIPPKEELEAFLRRCTFGFELEEV